MFDIGFWELTILAVIGLIVLGPERLPVVARTLGLWVGRAKGYVRGITSELEREVSVDELRADVRRTRERIESETRGAIEPAQDALSPERPSVKPSDDAARDGTRADAAGGGDASARDAPTADDGSRKTDRPSE